MAVLRNTQAISMANMPQPENPMKLKIEPENASATPTFANRVSIGALTLLLSTSIFLYAIQAIHALNADMTICTQEINVVSFMMLIQSLLNALLGILFYMAARQCKQKIDELT